jgi:glucose/arabinose dehydrogenase
MEFMLFRRAVVLSACVALSACSKPPDTGGDVVQISGSERIGWDQQAADASELAGFRYHLWVDGTSNDVTGASCASTAGAAGFACSGALPRLSAGAHTLELSAYLDGTQLESVRSPALRVMVTGQSVAAQTSATFAASVTTVEGIQLQSTLVADGLRDVTDLAFAADGRIFVAERGGRIRVIAGRQLQSEPAVTLDDVATGDGNGLLAIAVDPKFAQTPFVYAVYTASTGVQLARFVESHGRLMNRAVLMGDIPYRTGSPSASLRFGPDNKLYVGLDDGGDPTRAGDLGSYSGKVLRLNADATTPSDQAAGSPVYALNVNAPRGISWGSDSEVLWVAEAGDSGTGLLQAVTSSGRERRGRVVARYTLPAGMAPVSLATYQGALMAAFRGNLLIALGDRREILRLRLDASSPTTVVETELLPADLTGPVRAVAVSPDGTIYVCSPEAVAVLWPASAGGGAGGLRIQPLAGGP